MKSTTTTSTEHAKWKAPYNVFAILPSFTTKPMEEPKNTMTTEAHAAISGCTRIGWIKATSGHHLQLIGVDAGRQVEKLKKLRL